MRKALPTAAALVFAASAVFAQAPAADLTRKASVATLKGRVVLVPAGKGTAESLFANAAPIVLDEKPGVYTNGRVSIPFMRKVEGTLVTETADFSALPKEYAVAEYSLVLPLALAQDPHDRMMAFGAEGRVEMFRMDMNDVDHRPQNISDNRGYQPYWDIGRVLQLATGFALTRANHADSPAYPIDGGTSAPGWADYSEMDWGVTVQVKNPAKSAPWAMMIDARRGEFVISPRPADQPPISGADYGKREFAFDVTVHEGSWPVAAPCELPTDVYAKLLAWLDKEKHVDNAASGIGVTPSKDRPTLYRNIIFRNRIQPSILLRYYYRADAWRMSGIATKILGRSVPRTLPFDQWEAIAKEVIEKVKKDGI